MYNLLNPFVSKPFSFTFNMIMTEGVFWTHVESQTVGNPKEGSHVYVHINVPLS